MTSSMEFRVVVTQRQEPRGRYGIGRWEVQVFDAQGVEVGSGETAWEPKDWDDVLDALREQVWCE